MGQSNLADTPARVRRPVVGWLSAVGISAFGDRMSFLAVPWFVLTTTHSPVKTGLVAAAEIGPLLVLQVLSGPVIDRIGPGRVAAACDLASMLVVGTIPLLFHLGHLNYPGLLAIVVVAGALRGPGDGAKDALVPHIVEHVGVPMERATALENATYRGAMMLGAATSGTLIALIGPATTIAIDAVSFGISSLLIWWASAVLPRHAADDDEDEDVPYLDRLRAGLRFVRADRLLLGIAVMFALVNLFDNAYMTVLVPVWAHTYAGPIVVGLVFAVWNMFSMVGSLATARWGDRWPRQPAFVLGFLLGGLPRYAVFAFDSPIPLVMAVAVIGGFALGVAHPTTRAVQLDRIPQNMVGRVMTLNSAMITALIPFAGILGGVMVHGIGLTATMLTLGAVYVVVVLAPALDPAWKDRGTDPP